MVVVSIFQVDQGPRSEAGQGQWQDLRVSRGPRGAVHRTTSSVSQPEPRGPIHHTASSAELLAVFSSDVADVHVCQMYRLCWETIRLGFSEYGGVEDHPGSPVMGNLRVVACLEFKLGHNRPKS